MGREAHGAAAVATAESSIEDYVRPDGTIVVPEGVTLTSFLDRNRARFGDAPSYRFIDYSSDPDGQVIELSWNGLWSQVCSVGARLQQVTSPGDRVAILAPQGVDYVAAFFAAVHAGNIAVPLFAPSLAGHAERLAAVLADAKPAVVLTTTAASESVRSFLRTLPAAERPRMIAVDAVPDSLAPMFTEVTRGTDDIAYLQYTSGSTRTPAGVEITHRNVCTNVMQMILAGDLEMGIRGVSWLPLYHDMGLSMIGFPAVYGGHSTLLSPTAFIRRPQRWIQALSAGSREGRVVTAAPNFAYEWAAQRGVPAADSGIDLSNVVMIIGSEPVSIDAINTFNKVFAPFGLPSTAFKPSYGIAEATLFVATIAPSAAATVAYFDREQLAAGQAVPVDADAPGGVAQVACGQIARSLRAVIVDAGHEQPDGRVGEIWLQGGNVGRGYWGMPDETRVTFGARLRSIRDSGSHAAGSEIDGPWLRTGDLGFYLDGELYVTGRTADLITIDGRNHYPQDIEATVADAAPLVRKGYVAVFTVPPVDTEAAQRLVIISERASGTARSDPREAIVAIRDAVHRQHGIEVADVRFLPAGGIPRTTSGKLARLACRGQYLAGTLGVH